tara:strand:+ start:342 stop:539 length:198 start_codon:yes stop_codon:yes gene_type:complete
MIEKSIDNAATIAAQIEEASPAEAAKLWTDVAGDRTLAIKVHRTLGTAGCTRLAEKLHEFSNNFE